MKSKDDSLSRSLIESRPAHFPAPSPAFTSRVMAEVRLTPQEDTFASTSRGQVWWLAAAAVIALVAAGAVLRPGSQPQLPSGTLAGVERVLEWSPTMAFASYDVVSYDPAAAELEALRRDGQRALEFVKHQAAAVAPKAP